MSMSDEYRSTRNRASNNPKKKKSFKETFIPQKGDSSSELIGKIITLIAAAVLVVCAVLLTDYFYQLYEAKKNHTNIKVLYHTSESSTPTTAVTQPDNTSVEDSSTPPTEQAEEVLTELPAALKLLEENADTVGYIRIPNCVDEVVVQGEDNEYYLDHNFYNNKRQCGTCFADYRATVSGKLRSDNILLYAHNQKDGTMFGNLDYYSWDAAYWLKNPFIYFNTNYTEDTYVIISSFIINTKTEHDNGNPLFDYQNYINFNDNYLFEDFYDEIMKRSHFTTGIDCNSEDKYITLSTCSYEWDDARHLIVARKLRDNETEESIDTTQFAKNPNPKWPAIYYKYNGGTYIEE